MIAVLRLYRFRRSQDSTAAFTGNILDERNIHNEANGCLTILHSNGVVYRLLFCFTLECVIDVVCFFINLFFKSIGEVRMLMVVKDKNRPN